MKKNENELINLTLESSNKSAKKYATIDRKNPNIVINHLKKFEQLVNNHILDLGCGHGRDCKYFEDAGFDVVGIDLSDNMLDEARKVCDKTILLNMNIMDIGKIPWRFAGIWSCAVLHHVPESQIDNLLKSIFNILENDGILFLSFKIDNEGFVFKEEFGVMQYYWRHDTDIFIKKLRELGFEIIETFVEEKRSKWFNIYAKK